MLTRAFAFTAGLMVLGIALPALAQQLWLRTSDVEVRRTDESVSMELTYDGRPVPADAVSRVKLFVDRHDYDEMFSVDIQNGVLTLTPTDQMEMGRYELVVDTTYGTARGVVRVTLSHEPMVIENRARELGISETELRRRLGLATTPPRESLQIDIPSTYYIGQALEVSLEPPPTRDYMWIINGQVAKSGEGPHTLRYVFKRAGEYTIRYQERHANALSVDLTLRTTVIEEPPLQWEVSARQRVYVPGPAGYDEYAWRVDGEVVSTLPTFRYTFAEAGTYTVECIASSPEPVEKFRKITYNVTVR